METRRGDVQCTGDGMGQRKLRAFLFLSSSCWSWVAQGFFLLGGREDYEGHHPVAVANFLVIPGRESDVTLGNEFDRSGC